MSYSISRTRTPLALALAALLILLLIPAQADAKNSRTKTTSGGDTELSTTSVSTASVGAASDALISRSNTTLTHTSSATVSNGHYRVFLIAPDGTTKHAAGNCQNLNGTAPSASYNAGSGGVETGTWTSEVRSYGTGGPNGTTCANDASGTSGSALATTGHSGSLAVNLTLGTLTRSASKGATPGTALMTYSVPVSAPSGVKASAAELRAFVDPGMSNVERWNGSSWVAWNIVDSKRAVGITLANGADTTVQFRGTVQSSRSVNTAAPVDTTVTIHSSSASTSAQSGGDQPAYTTATNIHVSVPNNGSIVRTGQYSYPFSGWVSNFDGPFDGQLGITMLAENLGSAQTIGLEYCVVTSSAICSQSTAHWRAVTLGQAQTLYVPTAGDTVENRLSLASGQFYRVAFRADIPASEEDKTVRGRVTFGTGSGTPSTGAVIPGTGIQYSRVGTAPAAQTVVN